MPALPQSPLETPARAQAHIGVFDTGIGGLSVLAALQRRLPAARITYLADSRHTPWGDRPGHWVQARSLQLAGHLIDQGAGLILVACNTATTQAIAALRDRWPGTPFVGVEPGIKPAVSLSRTGHVAVMATTGTLKSDRLQRLVTEHAGEATVLRLACPGLAEAIERAALTVDADLSRQLDQIADRLRAAQVDTVVLGCTHYPLVADALKQRLGDAVQLVDTAQAVARRVASLLGDNAESPLQGALPTLPTLWATGDVAALQHGAARWLPRASDAQALHLPDPA